MRLGVGSPSHHRRNLVVCIDGTGEPVQHESCAFIFSSIALISSYLLSQNINVVQLYSLLEKSSHQLTYYNSGIGTYM